MQPEKAREKRSLTTGSISRGAPDQAKADAVLHIADGRSPVLVELNFARGVDGTEVRRRFVEVFRAAFAGQPDAPNEPVPVSTHYMRCQLSVAEVTRLGLQDEQGTEGEPAPDTVYRIWPDYLVKATIDRSTVTVKADAAFRTYSAAGVGVVWAVIDSGIDGTHPHFRSGNVTNPAAQQLHRDFTPLLSDGTVSDDPANALIDNFGHGTHVAGIIAGEAPAGAELLIAENQPTTQDLPKWGVRTLDPGRTLAGVAPKTALVSLKVLNDSGDTLSSTVIEALSYIRGVNADGRQLRIHGVNLSLGCDWFPDEFAAGQSPLCRELNLLVNTGVVAVVSAGNSGAGGTVTGGSADVRGQLSTITDPGNAANAITVGSTHRYQPHTFGVTYTSSKGPTLDGRLKPDLVAPGERITSAATGSLRTSCPVFEAATADTACYKEDNGTSMAAPHVSGAIAAFLSARPEYIGQPDEVKRLFMANATSLDRHVFYQGAGLVDLMRVLSNV